MDGAGKKRLRVSPGVFNTLVPEWYLANLSIAWMPLQTILNVFNLVIVFYKTLAEKSDWPIILSNLFIALATVFSVLYIAFAQKNGISLSFDRSRRAIVRKAVISISYGLLRVASTHMDVVYFRDAHETTALFWAALLLLLYLFAASINPASQTIQLKHAERATLVPAVAAVIILILLATGYVPPALRGVMMDSSLLLLVWHGKAMGTLRLSAPVATYSLWTGQAMLLGVILGGAPGVLLFLVFILFAVATPLLMRVLDRLRREDVRIHTEQVQLDVLNADKY
ncbi:hypothetical protein J8273_1031 [Carpediemonas membranifera]|uniref:Uncharacterized protein n=1 Tax=Carpediemonas membranifera TaxID=201153 RepID=A0A8J6AYE6_9EUKA|nr:hypothetical protein J8273_1031 [Carpediemonas membranifera]|eukprot:KAG9397123.1 hypothetical protein J8273_1031 [Carpediemonas membranifera]